MATIFVRMLRMTGIMDHVIGGREMTKMAILVVVGHPGIETIGLVEAVLHRETRPAVVGMGLVVVETDEGLQEATTTTTTMLTTIETIDDEDHLRTTTTGVRRRETDHSRVIRVVENKTTNRH
jgi:hypothetical protein